MQIRPVDSSRDLPTLLALWRQSFGDGWPVSEEWFCTVALGEGAHHAHLLAEWDGQAAGFALLAGAGERGSLLALAVRPEYRRRGIGRSLHQAALDRLRTDGARRVQPGAGAGAYFWPGVPADLPGAWPFFQALGWRETERSFDLVRDLQGYRTPAWACERVRGLAHLRAAQPGDAQAVVDFVTAEQPGWAEFYARAFREARPADVLLAVAGSGAGGGAAEKAVILGACLVESPAPRWAQRFAGPVGAPGCLLTAGAWQGRGIGLALAARATEILQERGCQTAFLGWTWLVDWYGRLGYTVWQEYIMSWIDT